ncbi:MAG: hypothetical protein RLN63_04300, partial [Miltoncostaeaceae bacterium]
REGRIEVVDPADPVLRRDQELDERRQDLVRQLADAPRLGSSVLTGSHIDQPGQPVPDPIGKSRGMRTRRS